MSEVPSQLSPKRLVSLDALRGFSMFWMLAGGGLRKALLMYGPVEPAQFFSLELEHARWEGFHFIDLVFPLFVFIVGVSLVFSLGKAVEREGRKPVVRRVVLRAVILFALGVFYNGGLARDFDEVRWEGVLQRIAVAYLATALLFLALKPRELIVACVAILAGYWALLTFVPVPGVGAGNFAEGMNLTNYFDSMYLPGRKYSGDHDPEGLLSNLPAVATCLLGVFAGLWLQRPAGRVGKAAGLLAAGLVLLGLGWAWAGWFPVIKKLWTSTYVLEAGGWSALLLGLFYCTIDERGWQRWARPFVWVGMNPITLYFIAAFVDFTQLASRITGGSFQKWLSATLHAGAGETLTALLGMMLFVLVARFLYQRGIFLRV